MSTVILSIGVAKSNTVHSPHYGSVSLKKKHPGSNVLMLPIVLPQGKTLDDKRKETHRLVDECFDAFEKDCRKVRMGESTVIIGPPDTMELIRDADREDNRG